MTHKIKFIVLLFLDSETDLPRSVYRMINVQDVNTRLSALIDKGEFASLPPCSPVLIPGDSSRSKSTKKRNTDYRCVKVDPSGSKSKRRRNSDYRCTRVDKPIDLAQRLKGITEKVIICLNVYEFFL